MIRISTIIVMGLLAHTVQAIGLDDPAPTFSGRSVDGRAVDLGWHHGKVTLISFSRRNCDRCIEQLPMLETLYREYREEGVEVISIGIDVDADEARTLVEKQVVSFPVLLDQSELISEAYTVGRMPYTVLVDRDGSVRYVRGGFWKADEKEYRDRIDILIRSGN